MGQQSKEHTGFAEDPSMVLSTHIGHLTTTPAPGGSDTSGLRRHPHSDVLSHTQINN